MHTATLTSEQSARLIRLMADMPLFRALPEAQLERLLAVGEALKLEDGEAVVRQGDESDCFFVTVSGRLGVYSDRGGDSEPVLLGYLEQPGTVGELGLLLGKARTASVLAVGECLLVRFDTRVFFSLFAKVPEFAMGITRGIAGRLDEVSEQVPLPSANERIGAPDYSLARVLPLGFMQRHHVLPVRMEGERLILGCVYTPKATVLHAVTQMLPGRDVVPVRVSTEYFEQFMESLSGLDADGGDEPGLEKAPAQSSLVERMDALLRRMVEEGASDLHLKGGCRPRWRLQGELRPLLDAPRLGRDEVEELLAPALEERHRNEYARHRDTDFIYPSPNGDRFRINLYRDRGGASAAVRLLPSTVPDIDSLGLPEVVKTFCAARKGLILVTGPTGSGKTTTLAAMLDHINNTRCVHVLTLEDPVEYLHVNDQALITQREVGGDTSSFTRGLRAALREDPDVMLVGELRETEQVALALDAANSGHLVFATLHTSTAATAIDRLIAMFPAESQEQVRDALSNVVLGVVAQTLAKSRTGGRVGIYEVMVADRAVRNLIREHKTYQLNDAMGASREGTGHMPQRAHLEQLVRVGKLDIETALAMAHDRETLAQRLKVNLKAYGY
ncbi:MAG: PilT/PilU family type 4a pilus ATPase [Gammaproteobacteria bacterium]